MSAHRSTHDIHKVVAVDELGKRYADLRSGSLTEQEQAFLHSQHLAARELKAKIRVLNAVRGDETLQAVFCAASGGASGLWEDGTGKAYMSGGFDRTLRAFMAADMNSGSDPALEASLQKVRQLEAQAFDACEDHRAKIGKGLQPMPLNFSSASSASADKSKASVEPSRPQEPRRAMPPRRPHRRHHGLPWRSAAKIH